MYILLGFILQPLCKHRLDLCMSLSLVSIIIQPIHKGRLGQLLRLYANLNRYMPRPDANFGRVLSFLPESLRKFWLDLYGISMKSLVGFMHQPIRKFMLVPICKNLL